MGAAGQCGGGVIRAGPGPAPPFPLQFRAALDEESEQLLALSGCHFTAHMYPRELAQVVVVAVADGAAQGPHELSGIVVGSGAAGGGWS
jgi:hypothetical protein